MCTCGQVSSKQRGRMCVCHHLCVFFKWAVALITGWVVLWIVACPHIRAACKIAPIDVLTRGYGSVEVTRLRDAVGIAGGRARPGPRHDSSSAVPEVATLGMSSQAAFTWTNLDLSVCVELHQFQFK